MLARKICFRFCDIRPAAQQLGRHPRRNDRRDNAVEILSGDIEAFRQAAEKNRQRVARLAFLLFERWNGRFDAGKLRLLLSQVQPRRHAIGDLGLNDRENPFGGVDILPRDRQPFA